jgi:hypothetical protein
MLERLFTANPFVRPIVDMPAVAYILWLVVAAVVFLVTLAVIAPKPIQRDARSFLEIGVMIAGALLISPLTEPPYLVLLIIPGVAVVEYVRSAGLGRPGVRRATLLFIGLWAIEVVPRHATEDFLRHQSRTDSILADLFASLATTNFFILLAAFGLQVYILSIATDIGPLVAIHRFIRRAPALAGSWVRDAMTAAGLRLHPLS